MQHLSNVLVGMGRHVWLREARACHGVRGMRQTALASYVLVKKINAYLHDARLEM
jgi:hypothetical protein